MDPSTKKDMEQALQAIASMTSKTERAKEKFAQGTAQHSLLTNRLKALQIASSIISKELTGSNTVDSYTKEDLQKAIAPIESLISKSEKAKEKCTPDTWQQKMLADNLKALHMVLPLLMQALSEIIP